MLACVMACGHTCLGLIGRLTDIIRLAANSCVGDRLTPRQDHREPEQTAADVHCVCRRTCQSNAQEQLQHHKNAFHDSRPGPLKAASILLDEVESCCPTCACVVHQPQPSWTAPTGVIRQPRHHHLVCCLGLSLLPWHLLLDAPLAKHMCCHGQKPY